MEQVKFTLIFFFPERPPVKYHSRFKDWEKTVNFIERKFGIWKYFNVYSSDGNYQGREYSNQYRR